VGHQQLQDAADTQAAEARLQRLEKEQAQRQLERVKRCVRPPQGGGDALPMKPRKGLVSGSMPIAPRASPAFSRTLPSEMPPRRIPPTPPDRALELLG